MAGEGLRSTSELTQRVVSAVFMAAAALGSAWYGGWVFTLVWSVLAVAVAYEWGRIVAPPLAIRIAGFAVVQALMAALITSPGANRYAWVGGFGVTLGIVFGLVRMARAQGFHPVWSSLGNLYVGLMLYAVLLLRGGNWLGCVAIFYVFAVVWMTDIGAYFAGRTFGGPKFAPSISPKKTWSGVIGGLVSGTVCSLLVLHFSGMSVKFAHVFLALILGIFVVYGDLFESFLKRRFGVKDAGSLIPGHGGFLDRLDGFAATIIIAALIGIARAGFSDPANGLLGW